MTDAPVDVCPDCLKPRTICVCDRTPALASKVRVVILQHPREEDVALGTARLVTRALGAQASIRVGLSWPSLEAALDVPKVDRARWGVVFAQKLPEPFRAR